MYCEIHSCALAFAMSSQLNVNLNILVASDWIRPLAAGRIKTLATILFWTKTSVLFIICVEALLLCHRIQTHEKEAFLTHPADLLVRKKWIACYCRPLHSLVVQNPEQQSTSCAPNVASLTLTITRYE